ncbi:hypothetical protein Dda_5451 [Drechslerella dactyloides]|uniref:Ricin B lectin domain-containing protein n=1 Tax=Drechslerella dactyloides TaxID=74499 RepID=A0AAD6NIQ9_DREDA|nr:hypothetical protein Dda_5451 [Drechslerella dactyloides]
MLAMIPMFYLLFWLSTLTGIHAIVDIKRLQTKFLTGPSATGIDSDPVNNHTFSINGVMIYFARNGTRYCLTERRLELPRYNLPDEDAIILKCNETNLAQRWFVNGTEHARYRNRTRLPSNERTWFTGTIRNSATRRCVYGRVFNTTGSRYQIGEIGLNGLINVDYVPYGRIYLTDCSYDRGPRQIEIDPFEDRMLITYTIHICLLLWIIYVVNGGQLIPNRDVDIEHIKSAPVKPYADGKARVVENNKISSYQYSLDYVQIFFTKDNKRYCLKDNADPYDPTKPADQYIYAVIEECRNHTDGQRWHLNGTQYTRFEVGKENPYIGGTWWKGFISNVLTRRCIYAKYNSPGNLYFPSNITTDGYKAIGMLYLADCDDGSIFREGIGQIEIDPYDSKSNEFIYPVSAMVNSPLGYIDEPYNCPHDTAKTLLVPETRSFPFANTTITPAAWGCAQWDFGTSSHIADISVSPIGNWVENVGLQEQCRCEQQQIYPVSLCQYQREQAVFDHWSLCDMVSRTGNADALERMDECERFKQSDKPPEPIVPEIDPKVCDDAWSYLGFPSADGVKPCADLPSDVKDIIDCATVSPLPTALT